MKKLLKAIAWIVGVIVFLAALGVGALTALEYRPAEAELAETVADGAKQTLQPGQSLSILSWNIGYAGLGAESDFFMDGGESTAAADEATVARYLAGIKDTVAKSGASLVMLQEVDRDSTRSYRHDQAAWLLEKLGGEKDLINRAYLVFVALDEEDRPAPVPRFEPQTLEEKVEYAAAERRRATESSMALTPR